MDKKKKIVDSLKSVSKTSSVSGLVSSTGNLVKSTTERSNQNMVNREPVNNTEVKKTRIQIEKEKRNTRPRNINL